ncbi:putative GPI transamidase component Gpi16 [Ascodesmis nigricans]|uniref:Putative GPI transamidase component Gpi16 n=1 Tax=Ascodesmis nigricans TaxID=341454 RepID=A0A4S2N6V7_9PEZI|nr:putative GPI transamidase component Gpi16 [Ascodesmis nigricans]
MRLRPWLNSLLLLFLTTTVCAYVYKDYDENLLLKTLPNNAVLASFRFVTNGTYTNHHSLFPRSLAQILSHSNTRELHLKFTMGRWDAESWGAQPFNGQTAGGTGVELWAWVEAVDGPTADKRWTTLTNALSGLFCASLNFIDGTRTIRPVMSFTPDGDHEDMDRLHLLHGSLPREPVCTENLTPFLKLLPCKGKVGISSLLDGHKLFDAQWQSMSIDVRPVCTAPDSCVLQLTQTVDMVLDVERSLQRRDYPVPRPRPREELNCDPNKPYGADGSPCFPRSNIADLPWSISEVFGRPLHSYCPLASEPAEHVCLDVPQERPIYITRDSIEVRHPDGRRCYTLPPAGDFDIILPQQSPALPITPFPEPPLYASRSFTGHGQEHGGVKAVIKNPHPTRPVEFVYLESLPWFMKPYLHTLKTTIYPAPPATGDADLESPVTALYYRPAIDRSRGTHLEASLLLPANSTLILTYDFEKAILRYTEYPPDANRGFDIAPAVITVLKHSPSPQHTLPYTISGAPIQQGHGRVAIRTTSLLLSLPTPDFSMPYNVIILTSTVMALAFGSVFNLLVRRFVGADEVAGKKKFGTVVEKIREKVRRLKGKRKTE